MPPLDIRHTAHNGSARTGKAHPDLFDVVRLTHSVVSDGHHLPINAEGTIVEIYRDHRAYEVEFFQPTHAIITVRPEQISWTF